MKYNVIVPSLEHSGPTNLALALASQARRDGFDVRVFFLNEHSGPSASLGGLASSKLSITDILSLTGVVHTHGLRPDITGTVIKAVRGKRVFLCTTIHMHFFEDLLFLHNWIVVKFAFKVWKTAISWFDRRFCISLAMCDYYKEFMPRMQFHLAYNGVTDQREVEPDLCKRSEIGAWTLRQREAGRKILGYVGALIERKNVVKFVGEVLNRSDIALAVCGDGPLISRLQAMTKNNDRIFFLGNQPYAIALLSDIDVFVLPSLSEGMPLVVLEAASIGKPTLMSDLAVHRELERSNLGMTFSHHDFGDFASRLHSTLDMDSSQARESYELRFTPTACWSVYHTEIRKFAELY